MKKRKISQNKSIESIKDMLYGIVCDPFNEVFSEELYNKIANLEEYINDYYWYGWEGDNGL